MLSKPWLAPGMICRSYTAPESCHTLAVAASELNATRDKPLTPLPPSTGTFWSSAP